MELKTIQDIERAIDALPAEHLGTVCLVGSASAGAIE